RSHSLSVANVPIADIAESLSDCLKIAENRHLSVDARLITLSNLRT
ncbi:MAG: hypothetical protein ACI9O4_002494, partial [Chitinophagales bacterium]